MAEMLTSSHLNGYFQLSPFLLCPMLKTWVRPEISLADVAFVIVLIVP